MIHVMIAPASAPSARMAQRPTSGRPASLVEPLEREAPGERAADLWVGEIGAVGSLERAF